MKVRFEKIPCQIKFGFFDEGNRESLVVQYIEPGDSEIEITIPSEWKSPYRVVSTTKYYVPRRREPIANTSQDMLVTGADFYADISREPENEAHNQTSVENLIVQIYGSDALSGRQKFYVSLVSLQSYYEHLVYGMLILSGYLSKTKYENLANHKQRTEAAFSKDNTDFFSTAIEIAPGKSNLGTHIDIGTRIEFKKIFDEVRSLRNKVVHRWGYKDVGRGKIVEIFEGLGENAGYHETDDSFYSAASFVFVRLYARVNAIKTQLSYFIEKEAVRAEREGRGY